jgi:hypothetical protein
MKKDRTPVKMGMRLVKMFALTTPICLTVMVRRMKAIVEGKIARRVRRI